MAITTIINFRVLDYNWKLCITHLYQQSLHVPCDILITLPTVQEDNTQEANSTIIILKIFNP